MTIDSISSASPARNVDRPVGAADTAAPQSAGRAPATALETASAVRPAEPAPTLEQVKQAVSDLNKSFQTKSQGLEFSVDNDSKRTIVKVVDQTTREVLRQMPSQEALDIAKALDTTMGLLIKQTA